MSSKNRTLVSLPLAYSNINYPQKLLSGLGKPTKRGIKKCPNCGVYNGTRSTMCKNKQCGVFLRDSEEKSNADLEAIKLITGTSKRIYSVRVRDMGPDHRGFIQLPLIQNYSEEDSSALSKVALCFVDSCQRSFDDSILKCHEEEQSKSNSHCVHINAALNSHATAVSLDFKNEVIHTLKIPNEFKGKILVLSSEKEGPLVQKVSKSVMAVKCQATPQHPLGYLHFTFIRAKGKEYYDRYYCSCTEFTASENKGRSNIRFKCIHYYACICALAGNPKSSQEFSFLINYYIPGKSDLRILPHSHVNKRSNSEGDISIDKKKVNVVSNYLIIRPNSRTESSEGIAKKLKPSIHKPLPSSKKYSTKRCPKIMPKILPVEIKVLNESDISSQMGTSWYFLDWLTYVTESINNTMQFENCGLINSLIFCIPEGFYKNLKQRIPDVYKETQIGLSKVFNIMNILHLKEIFDTPKMKLKISKKFVHNEGKGYIEYTENNDTGNNFQSTFIFFLNVGQSTVDESDNTNNSFVIEWIPNITSLTRIGQLKVQYKYGRKST